MTAGLVIVVILALVLLGLAASVRILKQYERGIQFRLGRVKDGARGPGLIFIIPLIDHVHRVSLRIVTMPIQSQGIITRDNVSVDVSAVAYYRVEDAVRSVVAIENVGAAIDQIAQTTLRAVVGRNTLDETLSETDKINQNIREILDVQTEEWGVKVTTVELKDIQLPESMQRAMARQAEAEREKRAKIIAARGRGARRRRARPRVGRDDGPPARAAAAQPADDGRDRRRQELHDHVPGAADEHDRRARGVPEPRERRRERGACAAGPGHRRQRPRRGFVTIGPGRSVAVVGGGFGGVGAAVMLRRAGYGDVAVFERGERVGGVWHHNTYPGAACDVPSHLYEFSFAPNPRWSRRYAPQAEIQAYLESVAQRHGVLERIRTNTEVQRARWDDTRSKWVLETSRGTHEADVLLTACGQLSVPAVPPIPGLGSFDGPAFHTAQWRPEVELAGRRVAVVGTGCSAIQVVPAIQPIVERVDVYQRSPGWTIPKMDFAYKERTQRLFERFPILQRLDRAAIFAFMELATAAMTRQRWLRAPFRAVARHQIHAAIEDRALRRKVTPTDELGCKRVMLTDDWYPTLTRPNVELVTDRIAEVTAAGIRTEDGTERPADVLVLATGFNTHGFVAPMEIVGAGGRTLASEWAEVPRAYLGTSVPGFPNMFLLYGPNTNGGAGSVVFVIEAAMRACHCGPRGARACGRAPDRGPAGDGRGVRPRAAHRPRRNRLAHRLHELVRRRERQRPEPVAVAVEHLSTPHGAPRARRLRAQHAGLTTASDRTRPEVIRRILRLHDPAGPAARPRFWHGRRNRDSPPRPRPAHRTPRAAPGDRLHRAPVGLGRLDHRLGLALRRAGGAGDGRPRRDHLVGHRRGGDPAARARPRRARRACAPWPAAPPLSALRLRRRGGRLVRLVLLAAGRDRRADRGHGGHPVRPALLLREQLDEGQRRSERAHRVAASSPPSC